MQISSILKKAIMAVSGLLMFGFLISHLTGNLLIIRGPEAFNGYSAMLASFGPLLLLAEAGLIVLFLSHAGSGIKLTLENRAARKQGYEVKKTAGQATLGSRTMAITGVFLFLFIPSHVYWFKFAHDHSNLWAWVMETFSNPAAVIFYVIAMLVVGLHLSHGVGSAFQSLGILKPAWRKNLNLFGIAVGWLIAFGFIILPIWAFMRQQS